MTEKSEHLKDVTPTERKSVWRTAEERRMSDLTRVLEWLERRQGKKRFIFQKPKGIVLPKVNGKEEKKTPNIQKQQKGKPQGAFIKKPSSHVTKNGDPIMYRKLYSIDPKGHRLSIIPGNYTKDGPRKSDINIKDAIALESTQRPLSYRHQSIADSLLQEQPAFSTRKSTLLKDWVMSRTSDVSYERKLRTLMEKGVEPKAEAVRMLKPEEVLSCRYLRLSKNNIRTLLKLCKDAGLNVDIHPHMVEGEIDAKKVFAPNPSIAL
ncbi:uncharacterized protein C16orf78 homolog isoform X1 [Vulpes vulpes]|uniref:Uncharacterized protein C16orf78 homolog isoform X1 n=2 Tax=Vulpes vulpes TaxID=9627 RepID=A0ABM4ZCQ9_VULVU